MRNIVICRGRSSTRRSIRGVLLAAPYQKFGSPVRLMLLIICVVGSGWAQNPSPESSAKSSGERGKVLFREHVRELLETRCLACHGGQFKKSGLDLSSRETLLKGGDRGPAVVPGDPKASLVYKAIAHIDEPHMPYQADKLPDAVIAEVGNWILAGAPYEAPLKVAAVGSSSSQAGLHHWAFQAPKKPPVPPVKTQDWQPHRLIRGGRTGPTGLGSRGSGGQARAAAACVPGSDRVTAQPKGDGRLPRGPFRRCIREGC